MSSITLPLKSHPSPSSSTLTTARHSNDDHDPFFLSGNSSIKNAFAWTRHFNETLATISNLLRRNFHDDHYPSGGNVSEASASTATIASNPANDDETFIRKTRNSFLSNAKRRRNSPTDNPKELDMLVMKNVEWDNDDSDSY